VVSAVDSVFRLLSVTNRTNVGRAVTFIGGPTVRGGMDDLVEAARAAAENAYAPYSEYPVGAALETADGTVVTGCNVESRAFSNTMHAEGVAVGAAVERGYTEFARVAVSSAARDGVTPCGICRQTLSEFCDEDFLVLCDEGDGVTEYTLGELLPAAMDEDTLD
jgi:cytidine deaminase